MLTNIDAREAWPNQGARKASHGFYQTGDISLLSQTSQQNGHKSLLSQTGASSVTLMWISRLKMEEFSLTLALSWWQPLTFSSLQANLHHQPAIGSVETANAGIWWGSNIGWWWIRRVWYKDSEYDIPVPGLCHFLWYQDQWCGWYEDVYWHQGTAEDPRAPLAGNLRPTQVNNIVLWPSQCSHIYVLNILYNLMCSQPMEGW